MKLIVLFSVIILSSASYGQWTEQSSIRTGSDCVWQVDLIGNVYLSQEGKITKFDTSGVERYSQSIKSLGRIHQIETINTMKILVFSEEQQTFSILDNTLSSTNKTYDLSDLDFGYVPFVSASSQPNKLWVYDQVNSKLVLLDYARSGQQQEIGNMRGILGASQLVFMKEQNNQLYLMDEDKKFYVFDLYGSLIQTVSLPEKYEFECLIKGEIYLSDSTGFYLFDRKTYKFVKVEIPKKEFDKVTWRHKILFLEKEGILHRYYGKF